MRLHNYTSSSVCVSFAKIKSFFFIKRVDTSLYSLKKRRIMLRLTGVFSNMSPVMRKPAFCICENKDADQLHGNGKADQRLCFRYTDSKIPLLSKSEISSLYSYSVVIQPGLCRTWSQTQKTGFLTTRLIYFCAVWPIRVLKK